MVEMGELNLSSIEETWGPNAKLHVTLPILLNNSLINFYIGFSGMEVGIGASIGEKTLKFMSLKISGNNTDLVYLPGISNKTVPLIISLDIYKNETYQPFVAKFLKQMIENFTFDGVITAKFEKLLLFKENYTFGEFDVAIPLVMDMESIFMSLVEQLTPSIIGGLVSSESNSNSTSTSLSVKPISLLFLSSPTTILMSMLGAIPKLQQYVAQDSEEDSSNGINDMINGLINDLIGSLTGGMLGAEMQFNLGLEVNVLEGIRTEFTITLSDFYIDEFFITIGMGNTDLKIMSKNAYGKWQNILGIKIDEPFEIKEKKYEDISLTLTIYQTDALCTFISDFIDEFFAKNATNTVNIRISGYTTLNLSGIYLNDLNLDYQFEDLDLGINGSEMIDNIFDQIYEIELNDNSDKPQLLDLWSGPISQIPLISQEGIDLESLFHLGTISIEEISETKFNEINEGVGKIILSIDVVNYMMSVDIKKLTVSIYKYHPNNESGNAVRLMDIKVGDGNGLSYATAGKLSINITIYKSETCENWLQEFLNSLFFPPDSWLNLSLSLKIFGCNIEVKPTYLPAINLTKLPIDLKSIFAAINPLTGAFYKLMGPRVSQDIDMDSITENVIKFQIGKIKLGEYQNVGPLNYEDSVLDVFVNLWLQPMFNMSINGLKLQLLDGDLYNALYVNGGHDFLEVAKEATIGQVVLNPMIPVYFNSCYPSNLTKDPYKPYIVNDTNAVWNANDSIWECEDTSFILDRNDPRVSGKTIVNITDFNKNATEGGGFQNDQVLGLSMPTLNNLSIKVELFNKSHGTWDTRYKRKFWADLGGPYFPVQKYGKEYGGYPDHYYVYHKYYSPLVSLLQKALKLIDETGIATDTDKITELIRGIAIAGMVNITMFSMDLTINLNNPDINALFEPISGLFLSLTGYAIKEYIRQSSNPLSKYQHPREHQMEKLASAAGIEDIFGDLMDMSSIPLDINEIILGISFPGIADRPNHAYSPQIDGQDGTSRCWDGHYEWDHQFEYTLDPERIMDYQGSLDDPFFTGENGWVPKENFIKDVGYEWFKIVVDNWAKSANTINPYFETNYSLPGHYQEGNRIEDPKKWPLLYDRDVFGGRCRTSVLNLHTGIISKIPFGLLTTRMSLWIENPYSPCSYMPMGYVWVNSSVLLMTADEILADPYVDSSMPGFLQDNPEGLTWQDIKDNYYENGTLGDNQNEIDVATLALCQAGVNGDYKIDEYGNTAKHGWVINFNIRLFEGIGSHEFFWQMISGGSFNIHFLAQGNLNFSFMGYEFYNLFLPYDILQLGDPSRYSERCKYSQYGGSQYTSWGIPLSNGTLNKQEEKETPIDEFWPHYILKQPTLEFSVSLPIDAILDFESFLDIGTLLSSLSGLRLEGLNYLVINVELPINNPVPLILWIENLHIEIGIADTADKNADNWPWTIYIDNQVNIPLVDLEAQGVHQGDPTDPYDLRYNIYNNWYTPHSVVVQVEAWVPLDLPYLIGLLPALLSGEPLWAKVKNLQIDVIIPSALDYKYELVMDLGDLNEPIELTIL
ncbi:MAG: hypothetical protein ACTSPW_04790 [Promethearchaeota archaeon]